MTILQIAHAVTMRRMNVLNTDNGRALSFMALLWLALLSSPTISWAGEEMVVINLNQATAEQMADGLVGVGMAKAQRIVQYRETYGPFVAVDELTEVQGIGQALLEKNRQKLTLE